MFFKRTINFRVACVRTFAVALTGLSMLLLEFDSGVGKEKRGYSQQVSILSREL
jgi:hypothetical protein